MIEEHVVPAGEKPGVTIETPILLLYEGEDATRCSRINPGSGGNLPRHLSAYSQALCARQRASGASYDIGQPIPLFV